MADPERHQQIPEGGREALSDITTEAGIAEPSEAPPDTSEARAEEATAIGEALRVEAAKKQASEEREGKTEPIVEIDEVEVDGLKIDYARYKPAEGAREGSTPLVFIGGFFSKETTYHEALKVLTETGREAIFLNPLPRRRTSQEDTQSLEAFREESGEDFTIPKVELEKASLVKDALTKLGIEEYFVYGHSQGGVVGTALNIIDSERSKALILQNSSGVASKHPGWREVFAQLKNTPRGMAREKELGRLPEDIVASGSERIFKNLWPAAREFVGAGRSWIVPALHGIKKQEGHAPIHLLWGLTDPGYPGERMHERVLTEIPDENTLYAAADSVSMFAHPAIGQKGVPKKYAEGLSTRTPLEEYRDEETGEERVRFPGENTGDLMHSVPTNFPETMVTVNQILDSINYAEKADA